MVAAVVTGAAIDGAILRLSTPTEVLVNALALFLYASCVWSVHRILANTTVTILVSAVNFTFGGYFVPVGAVLGFLTAISVRSARRVRADHMR